MSRFPHRQTTNSEEGYVLIGVLFLVVVILIGLAVAAPKVATQIRRDKELELYHRGMQYTRAIKMYYKKFGSYPISMDQLEKSNNIRFLRRRYKDPFTGKDNWRLIHVGESKIAQTGLFGQPVGASGAAGTNGASNNSGFNSTGQSGTGQSSTGSSFGNSFGGSNGGSSFGSSGSNSGFGQSSSGFGGSGSFSGNSGASNTPGSAFGAANGNNTSGSGFGSSGTGGASGLGASTLTSSNGSPIGSNGPIIGVASSITKPSIREYKKQKHYNEWEFVYNPQTDLGGLGGNTGMGMTGTGNTNNGFGSSFGSNNGSGFGSSRGSGFGNSGGSGFGNNPGGSMNGGSNPTNGNNPTNPTSPTNPNPTDPGNPNPNPNQPPTNQIDSPQP